MDRVNQLSMFGALAERDRILEAFREHHPTYLAALRGFARDLARKHGEVTIDALRAEIEARAFPMPREIGADERLFGVVFRCKDFRPVGMRRTTREAWAARVGRSRDGVMVYRLSEAA